MVDQSCSEQSFFSFDIFQNTRACCGTGQSAPLPYYRPSLPNQQHLERSSLGLHGIFPVELDIDPPGSVLFDSTVWQWGRCISILSVI